MGRVFERIIDESRRLERLEADETEGGVMPAGPESGADGGRRG